MKLVIYIIIGVQEYSNYINCIYKDISRLYDMYFIKCPQSGSKAALYNRMHFRQKSRDLVVQIVTKAVLVNNSLQYISVIFELLLYF